MLYVVPNVTPELPPGCRWERDEDGWAVFGATGQLIAADISAAEAAADAWALYRSFTRP